MEKMISVVILVYNGEKYIERTVLQILKSIYVRLELIIVNDGSIDHSLEICETLQKKDSRIYLYTKENDGVASARNYVVRKANGDYLCFLNCT